ncbi:MAG: elongation factor G [Planctomycetota bacterium]
MAHQLEDLRNCVLLGHGGSGKTAIVDALAFETKVSGRHGNSADGSSISDWEPEEKERNQTLTSHLFRLPWQNKVIQLIDSPGHADFVADALSSLMAAESALFTIDAPTGTTYHTKRLWQQAASLGRIILLTKMDAENASFDQALVAITESFGDKVVPITVPDGDGKHFSKVCRTLKGEGPRAEEFRATLEERVAEADDELMERYFEENRLSDADLDKYLPRAIMNGTVIPLLAVSGPSLIGIEELLGFLHDFAPSPAEGRARHAAASAESGEFPIRVEPDPGGPFAGYVFKIVSDPFVGKMCYLRIVRGSAKAEDGLVIARTGGREKVGAYLRVQGKETESVAKVATGDIVAVAKLESLELGDTVTSDGDSLFFETTSYPTPMAAVAVQPMSRGDEQKIGPSLEKIAAEDPTFRVYREPDTGELVCEGMSNLHLDVAFTRLTSRYKVAVERSIPRIPYRETVQGASEGHYRHKKQSGGRGQFGEVFLKLRTLPRGEGFQFVDKIVGGAIPRQFIPEVEKGIKNTMKEGPLAGYPVVDCEAQVHDGKFHEVDSDQISFQIAGGRAFTDAFGKARPILLEPMMKLEIHVPSRFTGDITSNLSSLRARMTGMDSAGDEQIIRATMPLKEAREYQTQLRSITAGEGIFTMSYSHYDPVPANIQAEIVAARKKAES